MIYGKLPVVFLSTIASEKSGSTNSVIAQCILSNLDQVKSMGIKEFAEFCHVGTGSISRFCKDIGLDGFHELKELLSETDAGPGISEGMYARKITDLIVKARDSISEDSLKAICKDLIRYDKISAFGLLKAESAAICFQADMLEFRKKIYTNVSFSEQTARIESAGKDELIIIFSYTGTYFDSYRSRLRWDSKNHPKIWMICGNADNVPPYVDEVLTFESGGELEGHPFQLLYAEGRIFRYLRKNFPEFGN